MKKNWKTLVGHCIYQSDDGFYVHQNLFYRWLTCHDDKAIQTLINRYKPTRPSLAYIKPITLALRNDPGDCCLLGLGGGAIVHAVNNISKQWKFIAVEYSQAIIELAYKYFMLDQIKNLEIFHQDANIFVQNHLGTYRHLLIDIYAQDSFPKQCKNANFFAACKSMLQEPGFLAINVVGLDDGLSILSNLRECFGQKTICIPIPKTANLVIIACQARSVTRLLALFEQSPEIKKIVWDAEWGYLAELRRLEKM